MYSVDGASFALPKRNYASKAKKKTEAVSSEVEAKPKPKRVVKKADPAEVTYG